MTAIGSGAASALTRSKLRPTGAVASSSVTVRSTRGRNAGQLPGAERRLRQPAQPGVVGRVHARGRTGRPGQCRSPCRLERTPNRRSRSTALQISWLVLDQLPSRVGLSGPAAAHPVVDGVRVVPAGTQGEQRHRIAAQVAGVGELGVLAVEAEGEAG